MANELNFVVKNGLTVDTDVLYVDHTNDRVGIGTTVLGNNKLSVIDTWNAGATVFTGIKLDVTNTASAATSKLLDLQVGSTSQFYVDTSGNVTVAGDLTVNGTTTTVNSTTVTIDDPVFTLGGDTAPASDDNLDRGIEFRWHDGAAAKLGFFGFDDSAQVFTFIPDATNTSEVFSGTAGNVVFGDVTANSNVNLGGDLVFQGASFNTTVSFTEPTAARSISIQDGSGTLAFLADITGGGSATFSDVNITNSIIFEGTTVDNFETTLVVVDPTQDNTITFQDASGTVGFVGSNVVGASNAATADAVATNGNVYLNHIENSTVLSTHNIIGAGGTTVTSDANGDITISSSSTANAFSTITVTDTDSGYTWAETGDVVADAVTDTVTFVSGTNIDIDVDATSDAVRIQTTTDQHVLDNHTIISNTQTTTAVTQVALDTFSATTFAGAEVVVTAIQGTSRHIIKMLVTHDGTDTYETQFGEIITGSSLFTLTSDINTGNVRILCTPASITSTKFNTYVTRIEN